MHAGVQMMYHAAPKSEPPSVVGAPSNSSHDLTDHCEVSDGESNSSALGKRGIERSDSGLALDEEYSRQIFNEHVEEWWKHQSVNSKMITQEKYLEIIDILGHCDTKMSKEREEKHRRYMKRYCVLTHNGQQKLYYLKDVEKATSEEGKIDVDGLPEVTHLNLAYDVIKQAHMECGFGGQHKTEAQLHKKFANIPRCLIKLYIDHSPCNFIRKKLKNQKEGELTVLPDEMNTRGLVALADRSIQADGQFKWLLFYQDHHTKFTHIRALQTNRPAEVGAHLAQIFVIQGAPLLLYTTFGEAFTVQVLNAIRQIWPVCRIIKSNPIAEETNEELMKCVEDVQQQLDAWMQQSNSPNWASAVPFIMYQHNTVCTTSSNVSAYRRMYNSIPRLGISSLHTTHGSLDSLQSEDQLIEFLQKAMHDEDHNGDTHSEPGQPSIQLPHRVAPQLAETPQFDFFIPPDIDLTEIGAPGSPMSWPSSPF